MLVPVKYHTLAFKSMARPEVWEEMSGGDTSMAGDGRIVAGTGVDVEIVPPSTVPSRSERHGLPSWPVCPMNSSASSAISQRSNWGRSQN